MKYLLLLLLFVTATSSAKEWKTDNFSIELPESMIVETDKERRLLAFSKNGPHSPPFLSIEFGKEARLKEILKSVNETIKPLGGKMASESCSPSCKAYYFEKTVEVQGQKTYMHHYLVATQEITFIISFTDIVSLQSGRNFVKDIGNQIRAKNI